jgi:hypothetical protein
MTSQRLQSCFVLAPRDVDTTSLRRALFERNVSVRDDNSLLASMRWQEARESAISAVDFVCVVISDGPADPNVLLDLGVAIGAGRPLLLFVDPNAELPVAIRDRPYARASLDSAEALRFHLDAFLKNAGKPRPIYPNELLNERSTLTAANARAAFDQIGAWEAGTRLPTEHEIVALLTRLFGTLNWEFSTVSNPESAETDRADVAVWIDELQTAVGNPLLIEVKIYPSVTPETIHSFQHRLQELRSHMGLLVCWEKGNTSLAPGEWQQPVVVVMGLRELVETLARGTFAQTMLSRRSSTIHNAA